MEAARGWGHWGNKFAIKFYNSNKNVFHSLLLFAIFISADGFVIDCLRKCNLVLFDEVNNRKRENTHNADDDNENNR